MNTRKKRAMRRKAFRSGVEWMALRTIRREFDGRGPITLYAERRNPLAWIYVPAGALVVWPIVAALGAAWSAYSEAFRAGIPPAKSLLTGKPFARLH